MFRKAIVCLAISTLITSLLAVVPQAASAGEQDFKRTVKKVKPVAVKPLRVKRTPVPKDDGARWKPTKNAQEWPAAGEVDLELPDKAAGRAGGLPVTVAKAAGSAAPAQVRVSTLSRRMSEALGVSGPVFTVSTPDDASTGKVELDVDYAAFAGRYGGDWASRLKLVRLPACAVTTPEKAGCSDGQPVQSTNATGDATLSSVVDTNGPAVDRQPETPAVYALTADADSDSGDYKATDLAASGSWTAGGNSGGFNYSVPMRVPPAQGPAPEVALSYSSQSIDGRTVGKNNQASWVGDGWSYAPGFVERSYDTCVDDRSPVGGQNPNNASKKTSDLCWRAQNATVSLNGTTATLVRDDASGRWRVQGDANWRVQHVTDLDLNAYDNDGEYWKITTPDGVQHWFGRYPATSHSTWTAPVFGNHPGEPCHATGFKDSSCAQGWRWMLDRAVDPNGNETRFYYSREVGHYGAAGDADNRVSYIRGGFPTRIEYGQHTSSAAEPVGKVLFTDAARCFTSPCYDGDKPEESHWPDVPWDRECDAAPCTEELAPAFYSSRRLARVTTQVRTGTSAFTPVESWELDHVFLQTDVLRAPVLWLKSITHRGHAGTDITDPPMVFTSVGMDNRVEALDNIDAMHRFRIGNVRTESGADIHVTYSGAECKRETNMPSAPDSNAKRCYPVYWQPDGFENPTRDWFHKYVVTEIAEIDGTGGTPVVHTKYDYETTGGGTSQLWAFDDNEMIKTKYRTYGQWRGFPKVTTRVGDGDPGKGPEPTTTVRYYRGMDGQPLAGGGHRDVNVTDSEGNAAADHEALAGQVREEITYNASSIAEASTNTFWTKQTARNTYPGGSRTAYLTGVSWARARVELADGVWRRTHTHTSYNDEGQPVEVNDFGDTATSSDDLCTRTDYVASDTAWLRGLPRRVETVAAACAATPSRPDDVVSDVKTFYDGATSSYATPTNGLVTRTDEIDGWADGTATYLTTARAKHDSLGRVTEATDAKDRTGTTAYTPAGPGPVTKTTSTNPAGHQTVTDHDPAYGLPTAVVDPNSKRTDLVYDALGRLRKVWLPGRAKDTATPHLEFGYLVRNDGPLAVTTKRLAPKANYLTTINLFDARYRPRQTQTVASGGGRLINTIHYNERGQEVETTGPNYASGDPNTTISTVDVEDDRARVVKAYDPMGRVTSEQFWSRRVEQWRTSTRYGGNPDSWQVAVTPPEGRTASATLTDARARVRELRQFHGASPSGGFDATTYTYTPRGDRKTITFSDGRVLRYGYDLRGRQTAAEDPDKGRSETRYDATDQITSTTDARGVTVSSTYDKLDRPVARYAGDSTSGTKLAEWVYDTVAKGQMSKTTTWIDGQAFVDEVLKYSDRYQPVQYTTTIPAALGLQDVAGRYLSTTTYLPDGSPKSNSRPVIGRLEREGVTNVYDDWGNVVDVGSDYGPLTTIYVDKAVHTPYGEVQQRTLGRDDGPQAQHTYVYEDATRRLARFLFDRQGTTVPNVAQLRWSYDDAGNVTSVANTPEERPAEADVQCFGYDYLRRMTEAWSQAATPCASSPSPEAVGGVAPYWQSYRLGKSGSRTGITDHQASGDVTSTYAYDTAGKPNAVSTVTTTGKGSDSYRWDEAGNLTSRTRGGATDTIAWDALGKPVEIKTGAGMAKMVYNAAGDRIARIDADGTVTAFIHGDELTKPAGSATTIATRYYSHDGQVVASRSTGKDVYWLAADRHGSLDFSVNSDTLTSSVKRRDPFGNVREHEDPSYWPTGQQGYVGGIDDPTGLVQLGARGYDPTLGAFTSVDPLIDPTDPQRAHPYAYANNAPATSADPSGLGYTEPGGHGCTPGPGGTCGTSSNINGGANKHNNGGNGGCNAGCNLGNGGTNSLSNGGDKRPWAAAMERAKRAIVKEWAPEGTTWDQYVGPNGFGEEGAPDHIRAWALQELQDRLCEDFAGNCADVGLEIAAGAVWMAHPKGLLGKKELGSTELVRRATAKALKMNTGDLIQQHTSRREWEALKKNGKLASLAYGNAVHRATAFYLKDAHGERFAYRTRGVDFLDRKTGALVELTTGAQISRHTARSQAYFQASYVAYRVGLK